MNIFKPNLKGMTPRGAKEHLQAVVSKPTKV